MSEVTFILKKNHIPPIYRSDILNFQTNNTTMKNILISYMIPCINKVGNYTIGGINEPIKLNYIKKEIIESYDRKIDTNEKITLDIDNVIILGISILPKEIQL